MGELAGLYWGLSQSP